MCTLLTVSRDLFESNKEMFDYRIRMDATLNRDGFALVLLGDVENETVVMQSLSYDVIMSVVAANKNWKRMFLHTRAATTKTGGIFGCHNFFSSGNGEELKNSSTNTWIVQHNGILGSSEASDYLVDSMLIADMININGVEETEKWLLEKEVYANVFMINVTTGEYRVVRCQANTLYTDGNGNYSTKIVGSLINQPVETDTKYSHTQKMKAAPNPWSNWSQYGGSYYGAPRHYSPKYRGQVSNYIGPSVYGPNARAAQTYWREDDDSIRFEDDIGDLDAPEITDAKEWDRYVADQLQRDGSLNSEVDLAKEYDRVTGKSYLDHGVDGFEEIPGIDTDSRQLLESFAKDEIKAHGDEAILYQEDEDLFRYLCQYLGYGVTKKIPNALYSDLTQEQKGWFKKFRRDMLNNMSFKDKVHYSSGSGNVG